MLKGFNKSTLSCQLTRSYSTIQNTKKPITARKKIIFSTVALTSSLYCGWEYLQDKTNQLDTDKYKPLKLLKKEQISPDSYRLRISTKQQSKQFPVPSCLYIKDDTIQVMRPYTPVNADPYKDGFIDLVVKKYQDGSVSRTLSGFEPNDEVHVRGPMTEEYEYKENSLDEVGMIAGGTGIAPMYQIISKILENPNDKNTRIWLVYGNKTEQDILLRSELDQLQQKYGDRFKVQYIVEQGNNALPKGYITQSAIQSMMDKDIKRRKVFVCGPSKMMELVCGERARDYSQGQVTGLLSHLGLDSNEVWKFQ
ncbi:hypothetical protein BDF21DRAFT_438137 [Thamnidium elegans]|nr:hypothetical protein BDF21DRAFT_438137 [Thamnidium elegans]